MISILFISFSSIYLILLLVLIFFWERIKNFEESSTVSKQLITVLIPARNEENNILQILSDLNAQLLPGFAFEVIVIDDNSTDNTGKLATSFKSNFPLRIIENDLILGTSFKKRAIEKGIEHSNGELIITTDADCRLPKTWLSSIVSYFAQTGAKMICGPVMYLSSGSVFQEMQTQEFSLLIGSGAASLQGKFPNMCNGANLCYEKKAFYEVGGFSGNENIASGDDEFLMHKFFEKFPEGVRFLKSRNAIVGTYPPENFKAFFNQRKRWASKSGKYKSLKVNVLAFGVLLWNIIQILAITLGLMQLIPWNVILEVLGFKIFLEYVFLLRVNSFMGRKMNILAFITLELLYPFYVISIGFFSRSTFTWKGRIIQKNDRPGIRYS